ncbi:anthranilate synthase component I [Paeniglutamicibacter cryotolerans]|uniref:Anthranilate synthase component 1 n=1 Tax=Paeniglutamicibacter cryotolerans TaxID=670079 RepID=A0A839QMD6_9MICC|nr:anthranilate synthase component I [Paeniglutamicibacter cryotolerans]MBB2996763.1 anthranilate synthase component 1 [Paeniglutamicibacter cryotolerans]
MHVLGVITPSREQFRHLAAERRVVPVTMTVLADALTPIAIYQRLANGRPGTFLMESAAAGGVWSRYSFIGTRSPATLTTLDGAAHWIGTPPAGVPTQGNPVEVLRDTVRALRTEPLTGLPPLTSGMVGFVGWEAVRHWEKLPNPPVDDLHLPEIAMNLVGDMAAHDNTDGTLTLIANAINFNGLESGVDAAYDSAVGRVREMLEKLTEPAPASVSVLSGTDIPADELMAAVTHSWDEDSYRQAILCGKEAIVEGEVFQVVVSRRFELETAADPLDIYRILRATNPSPYMYLYSLEDARGGTYSIVGSSPEALVTVNDAHVVTHPIAGSRPRGATYEDDALFEKDLLADEKERAEHLMLVDLSRNDLSKVCVPGSVEVTQFMEVERFSHIMHLVSNVVGRLEKGKDGYDVLAATFPAGTLSGAPKPRALRLLDELEPHRRGVYGGVVGYLDFAGDMDMAIAIRSALIKDGRAYVQAGGGIVADSQLDAEALETVNKTAAPLRAVWAAGTMAPAGLEDK